jgi:hypothetical protein
MKAGTTALGRHLSAHPDIYMSPVKEPHYFSRDIRFDEFRPGYRKSVALDVARYLAQPRLRDKHTAHFERWDDYLQLFREAGKQKAVGEASVGYLYSAVAAAEIRRLVPDSRIIIVLRNPVERAYSHFCMDLDSGEFRYTDFCTAVERDFAASKKGWGISNLYVEAGLYHDQVRRYIERFGHERVKIVLYDDLLTDAGAVVAGLYEFLGVDSAFRPPALNKRFNVSSPRRFPRVNRFLRKNRLGVVLRKLVPGPIRKPLSQRYFLSSARRSMTDAERRTVLRYFEDDIRATAALIGRDLSAWLRY